MASTRPSSNWFALQKSLPRKWPGGTSSKRRESNSPSEPVDLETTEVKNGESVAALRKMVLGKMEYKSSQTTAGKYLAIDCEMVGVGIEGSESSLARVSIVNYTGAVILDVFIRQRERVVDYRTQWSGVRSSDLADSAKPFKEVQQTVADLIKDRVLVGHAIYNDLKALLLSHPSPQIRDTQSLAYKHCVVKSRRPALRVLVKQELGIIIQGGEHSSVTDARATMALFRLYKKQWESSFRPIHRVAQSRSSNNAGDDSKSKSNGLTRPSASLVSSSTRSRKRKRVDSTKADDNGDDGMDSSLRAHSPAPSSAPLVTKQHISTFPEHRNQSTPQPPGDFKANRKGASSGISTVTRRAGGIKEVWRKGITVDDGDKSGGNSSKSRKKMKSPRENWWKSLGGG